jgi:hypothetical protein
VETLAGLDFVTWHLLGYEEFVAGYNSLLKRRLLVLLDQYLDVLHTLLFQYSVAAGSPRNLWHLGGVGDGLEYVERLRDSERAQPLANYRDYLGCYFVHEFAGTCDYCGKLFQAQQGCLAQDMIQDHAFCTRECAVGHRQALFTMIPQLQKFYNPHDRQVGTGPYPDLQIHDDWYLRPLPYNEGQLRTYFDNLPAPDLQPVEKLQPIDWNQWQPKYFTPRLKP